MEFQGQPVMSTQVTCIQMVAPTQQTSEEVWIGPAGEVSKGNILSTRIIMFKIYCFVVLFQTHTRSAFDKCSQVLLKMSWHKTMCHIFKKNHCCEETDSEEELRINSCFSHTFVMSWKLERIFSLFIIL